MARRKTKRKKTKRKKAKRIAEKPRRPKGPYNWDKVVSVAYLRLLGASREAAAKEAGCVERSVYTWEHSKWWPEAQAEARQRWLRGGDAGAMRGLLKAFGDPGEYAQHSRWWADRRIPELKRPGQKHEHTGKDGGPIQTQDISRLTDEELDVAERLIAKAAVDESTDQD